MKELHKHIVNGRILKNNGSWLYCDKCNKTVGYLVYSKYLNFRFDFDCKCGNKGYFELEYKTDKKIKKSNAELITKKNRLCCPVDEAPLLTIVEKNIEKYTYSVTCNKCFNKYKKER